MTAEEFWKIVQKYCREGEEGKWADALMVGLEALGADEIVAWNDIFDALAAKAIRGDLRGVAYVINGDNSERGFYCFRSWLIGKGKKVYEAALEDPDSLADVVEPYVVAMSAIHGSAHRAWVNVTQKTWKEPYPSAKEEASSMAKKRWIFDASEKQRFPRLAAMHLDDGAKIRALEPRLRRLFECACCRRHWEKFTDARSRFAIEVAERHADGQALDSELEHAANKADEVWVAEMGHLDVVDDGFYTSAGAAYNTAIPMGWWGGAPAFVAPDDILRRIAADLREEIAAQGMILRDFILPEGIIVPKVGRSDRIAKLADEIYRAGEFERIGELGMELRKAGADGELVTHCEEGYGHVRGCWVVDVLSGRRTAAR